MERYLRQIVFSGLGRIGQQKLLESTVAIVGLGALGSVAANLLCRAGVGHIRLIDRDYVEKTNLQRQILYNENDAEQHCLKAVAAFNHLSKINSEIVLEPVVAELNAVNIEQIFENVNLVLDGLDNWETRFLMNEFCRQVGIPWIYCAALGSEAMSMNLLPDEKYPCLRCFLSPESGSAAGQSCATVGILNMATGMIAAVQVAEAVKILTESTAEIRNGLFVADLWNNRFKTIPIEKDSDCPVCVHRRYEFLRRSGGFRVTRICGSNSIQISPPNPVQISLETMAKQLAKNTDTNNQTKIEVSPFMLNFDNGRNRFQIFQDGRAIIENAGDEMEALSLYSEYVGL
ncbi:MAG: ThiF family adenylyltransferase [Planctomycetaceae bacterium]|jgi:adenylyltransferase/sulfurtransferase|nr:ThiF family adenylyltransferase [Planctomycetaceae bacterium]